LYCLEKAKVKSSSPALRLDRTYSGEPHGSGDRVSKNYLAGETWCQEKRSDLTDPEKAIARIRTKKTSLEMIGDFSPG